MAKTQHTHKGHCQICGKLHAVDNATGKLADHGYNIPAHWHMRTGSCMGAMELPYEKSRDMIPPFIAMLNDSAVNHDAAAARVRAEGTDRDLNTDRMSETIARTPAGLVLRTWNRPDAWAAHAGAKPTLRSERAAAELYKHLSPAENVAMAERIYADAVERLAKDHAYRAEHCRRDAAQWQQRFDAWVADAPLVAKKVRA